MIADKEKSLIVETTNEGMTVYDGAANVLTNAPEYPFHAVNLRQYAKLTNTQPTKSTSDGIFGIPFSSGFGGIGLPGDFSSASRFIKAAFVTKNSSEILDEAEDGASELLRALFSVAVPRGSVKTEDGRNNYTVYTSCMDVKNGKYHRLPYSFSSLEGMNKCKN